MATVGPKVKRQVTTDLLPLLHPSFMIEPPPSRYGVIRAYGCFTQTLYLGIGRYGDISVGISFYVLGAQSFENFVPVIMGLLSADFSPRLFFANDEVAEHGLDMSFIVRVVQRHTPLSFLEPLTERSVLDCLNYFERRAVRFYIPMHVAFYHMAQGDYGLAPKYLRKARKMLEHEYRGVSQLYTADVMFFERMAELERYAEDPAHRASARADAERHAEMLKLPPIVWPD